MICNLQFENPWASDAQIENRKSKNENEPDRKSVIGQSVRGPLGLCLGDDSKPLVGEVAVECEGGRDRPAPHHQEAGAVHEAEVAAGSGENRLQGGLMLEGFDPMDLHHGQEAACQGVQGVEAETTLHEGARFYENVVGRDQRLVLVAKARPDGRSGRVGAIGAVERCQESGGVDECGHWAWASAR